MVASLVADIVKAVSSSNEKEIILRECRSEVGKSNELIFFFKPECFLVNTIDYISSIIDMVLAKLASFKVTVSGAILLAGPRLEELGIMDRHYGYINKLSRNAAKIVTQEQLQSIYESLSITNPAEYRVLGGHEALENFTKFDEASLDKLWATKKSLKLRSGFYFEKYTIDGEDIILVNGFHPIQLRHFTHPSHKIVLLLLNSDTDWKILKNDLAGNTFPEKAVPGSIRGELYKNSQQYGLANVSIANNCVHLSAGPFEALS
ncbi:MAG: hypothetical protein AB1489_37980, partial [Acidobacteriota bacterium]